MSLREDIRKLWREAFPADSAEYVNMYFDRVYRDSDVVATIVDGHPVSSLLLQQYALLFHGVETGMSYIAGAATRRQMRGKGLMSALVRRALVQSRQRGDMLCSLIPASDWLYYYYERLGFATVFYVDQQRFTSLHTFEAPGSYTQVDNAFDDTVWHAFDRLQRARPGMVIHSRRDFLNILDDLSLDGGRFVAMADESGRVSSMAWAVADTSAPDGVVTVRELLADDSDAAYASLRALRAVWPDRPFKLLAEARGEGRKLFHRGMARIVDPALCLSIIAASRPKLRLAVRVFDGVIPENSHTFIIAGGAATIDDAYTGHLDLDVDIPVLTRLVFSSPAIGDVIGLPAERPHISLMLD